ncbi:MAG: C-GCAxxG-C-C family protein [Planctomycetia bacterium]|nr:C-GCAxxG-C-C family protein [Planctomycetia bacterium]
MENSAKGKLAREFFHKGANCAQAVACAFTEECGQTSEKMARLASGFGAGMGRMREVCGAVSGMTLVANLIFGPDDIMDKAGKDAQYAHVQALAERFKAETGSIVCRELLGLAPKQSDSPISEARTETYYKKRPCVEMVVLAATILEEYLQNR